MTAYRISGDSEIVGAVTMAVDSVANPTVAPTIEATYDYLETSTPAAGGLCRNIADDGWVYTTATTLYEIDDNGIAVASAAAAGAGGVTLVGSAYFVTDGVGAVTVHDSTLAQTDSFTVTALGAVTAAIGTDDTNVLIASDLGATLTVQRYDTAGVFVDEITGLASAGAGAGGVYRGSADHGTDRWVVQPVTGDVRVFSTAGARQTAEEWPRPYSLAVRGLWWDGTYFYSIDTTDGVIYRREPVADQPGGTQYWSYGWTSPDGLHYTTPSPETSFVSVKGAQILVTAVAAPDAVVAGGVASRVRVYGATSSGGTKYETAIEPLDVGAYMALVSGGTIGTLDTAATTNNWSDIVTAGSIIAGDPAGKRVAMDGTGTPAFEAYNSSNVQTVNIDGENNYMEGTFATAADGGRVEFGPGAAGTLPFQEGRFYSGSVDETSPAVITAGEDTIGFGSDTIGLLTLQAQGWDGAATSPANLRLLTAGSDGTTPSAFIAQADVVQIEGETTVGSGNLNATMAAGSVGTGTFRTSVDARVTAVGGAAYQPLDGDLTAVAALSPSNDDVIQRKAGAWTNRTMAQVKTDLALVKGDVGLGNVDNTSDAAKPVSTATQTALDLKANLRRTINTQTGTSYTLVLTDEFKVIQISNAATHTLTVPPNASVAFPTGSEIEVVRLGGGAVTIAAGAGVTITSRSGLLSVNGQYGSVRLRKRAADIWHLSGDLA